MIGDAAKMPKIGTNSANFTLAYASIGYACNPVAWMREMLRATEPNGQMLLYTTENQMFPGMPLDRYVDTLEHGFGYGVEMERCSSMAVDGTRQSVFYFRIGVPPNKVIP